ncbi:hypothetical protein DW201_16870 [Enterococcus casseliflavus]|nr:hypothetical protein DW201_16870 [Enterococcus casseliflavus]
MGLLVKDHVLHPTHCRSSASAVFFCCLRSSGVIRKKHCCSNGRLPVEQQCFNCLFLLHLPSIERWELFYSCFIFRKSRIFSVRIAQSAGLGGVNQQT